MIGGINDRETIKPLSTATYFEASQRANKLVTSLLITHADDGRGSKAFSGVCLSVCLSVRTVTQNEWTKVFNIGTRNDLGK